MPIKQICHGCKTGEQSNRIPVAPDRPRPRRLRQQTHMVQDAPRVLPTPRRRLLPDRHRPWSSRFNHPSPKHWLCDVQTSERKWYLPKRQHRMPQRRLYFRPLPRNGCRYSMLSFGSRSCSIHSQNLQTPQWKWCLPKRQHRMPRRRLHQQPLPRYRRRHPVLPIGSRSVRSQNLQTPRRRQRDMPKRHHCLPRRRLHQQSVPGHRGRHPVLSVRRREPDLPTPQHRPRDLPKRQHRLPRRRVRVGVMPRRG